MAALLDGGGESHEGGGGHHARGGKVEAEADGALATKVEPPGANKEGAGQEGGQRPSGGGEVGLVAEVEGASDGAQGQDRKDRVGEGGVEAEDAHALGEGECQCDRQKGGGQGVEPRGRPSQQQRHRIAHDLPGRG